MFDQKAMEWIWQLTSVNPTFESQKILKVLR